MPDSGLPDSVLGAAARLREVLAGFEAGVWSGPECARLAEELAATEKACASVRLLAAARAVAAGVHRQRGFSDGAAWLARQSGSTAGQARQALATAERLEECGETREALLAGDISLSQAAEIVGAEAATPGAETELLAVARTSDLSRLRDSAREHRQAHTDPAELRRGQFGAREFRHWQDRDGMIRFAGALPPEAGLPLVRRVEAAALRARRAARAAGRPEPFPAHAADALAALVAGAAIPTDPTGPTGTAGPAGPTAKSSARAELVIVCDLFAWRRGHPHPGEACHLIGGGPIPVEVAQQLGRDAFLKAVLHDGANIHTVTHYGRHLPALLRTALDLGPVPAFTGRACVDCGRTWGLEYDHVDPLANHGATRYTNLQARCWPDHQAKTERDRQAGLLGAHPPTPRSGCVKPG